MNICFISACRTSVSVLYEDELVDKGMQAIDHRDQRHSNILIRLQWMKASGDELALFISNNGFSLLLTILENRSLQYI